MVKEIIHDPFRLSIKSSPATEKDMCTAMDLLDTLKANRAVCVGMAANMIGVSKRIICFAAGNELRIMLNTEIVSSSGMYETEEGCLSLSGKRKTKRYKMIKVRFDDINMTKKEEIFSGFTAQIIQHEIDHCNGILI